MGASCSTCEACGSPGSTVTNSDLLAEEDEAQDQVSEMVMYESVLGKPETLRKLPRLLGSESLPSPSPTESTVTPLSSRRDGLKIDVQIASGDDEDRFCVDVDRLEQSIDGSVTHRHLSDPALNTGRHSEANFAVSSYPVIEALNRYKSRHVIWAPSPTHSVHRSEKSVLAYGEVYGMHPASFDFNKRGQKIDSSGFTIGPECGFSPTASLADSDDDSPPHDGRFGRHPDFTKKMGQSAAKVVQAPRAPPGAILYN